MFVEGSGNLVPFLSTLILILLLVITWLLWPRAGDSPDDGGDDDNEPKEKLVNRQYADNQIIIGGNSEAIENAIGKLNDSIELTEILYETAVSQEESAKMAESFNEQKATLQPRIIFCPMSTEAGNDFQFRHFRVKLNPRGFTMPEIETKLNILKLGVCASANYAVGLPVNMIEGDPGSGEGFPGSGEGFGVSGGGSPVSPTQEHAVKANFYNQWAFHTEPITTLGQGIHLYNQPFSEAECMLDDPAFKPIEQQKRMVKETGKGSRIVIFDSSPYDDFLTKKGADVPPFIQKVVHNELKGTPDARDHGFFVASLASAVAPDSEIYLYRVLNDSNGGYLDALLYNLCHAINEYKRETKKETLCGLVLNLSMGIHVEERLRREVVAGTREEEELVPALYCLLQKAHEEGAIIVAAVGNDSAQQSIPKPAQVPAIYSFVIGVEAGNFEGNRSCFSNRGNVRAPGGDNLAGCLVKPYESLTPEQRKVTSVIGFVKEISPVTKYAFWRGTSFAAPMVSGLAALLLSIQISEGKCDPGKVEKSILGSSAAENAPQDSEPSTINVFEAKKRLSGRS